MIGMPWFDKDKNKTQATKMAEAATYNRDKCGAEPDTCILRLGSRIAGPVGMKVSCTLSISKDHLLSGAGKGNRRG